MQHFRILGVLLLVIATPSFACSCPWPLDFEKAEEDAEYVFIGSLERKNPFLSFSKNRYKFKVLHTYKGMPGNIVTAWSAKISAMCGIDEDRQSNYVVFVHRKSEEERPYILRCSTWPMNEGWKVWTEEFKQLHPDT